MAEQYPVDIHISKLIKRKRVLSGGWDYLVVIGDGGYTICRECYLKLKIEFVRRH